MKIWLLYTCNFNLEYTSRVSFEWNCMSISIKKIDLNILDPGHPHQTIAHPTHIHKQYHSHQNRIAELEPPPNFHMVGIYFAIHFTCIVATSGSELQPPPPPTFSMLPYH